MELLDLSMCWTGLLPGDDRCLAADDSAETGEVCMGRAETVTVAVKLSGTRGLVATTMSHGIPVANHGLDTV
jgi:hypothetical protein